MCEQYKKLINMAVWVGIALFFFRCLISLSSIINNFSVYTVFGYAGEVICVTVIIICCYEKWLWKYNPLEKTPVLNRYYIGTLKSTYDDIERRASLEIKQTLLSTHVVLDSSESKSKSISSSVIEILGEKLLIYCYLNTPKATVRKRSEIHYGTAMLCIENPNKLTGQYFSDRGTTGDMEFLLEQKEKST